ncbi:MAG: hypothetical protein ABF289_05110 [Clostridiales bacterium]
MKNTVHLIVLIVSLISVILISGCSIFDKVEEDTIEKTSKVEDKMDIKENKELTKEIKSEKGLYDGKVYIQDDYVIATMVVKEKIKKDLVDELVDEYGEKLKKEYKGKKINIQAVQDGENIANKTIEGE